MLSSKEIGFGFWVWQGAVAAEHVLFGKNNETAEICEEVMDLRFGNPDVFSLLDWFLVYLDMASLYEFQSIWHRKE